MIAPHVILQRHRRTGAPAVYLEVAPKGREELIRDAAYLRAERRGFAPGHELEDWLAAEQEVDHWLATRGAPKRYARPR